MVLEKGGSGEVRGASPAVKEEGSREVGGAQSVKPLQILLFQQEKGVGQIHNDQWQQQQQQEGQQQQQKQVVCGRMKRTIHLSCFHHPWVRL